MREEKTIAIKRAGRQEETIKWKRAKSPERNHLGQASHVRREIHHLGAGQRSRENHGQKASHRG